MGRTVAWDELSLYEDGENIATVRSRGDGRVKSEAAVTKDENWHVSSIKVFFEK